MKRVMTHAWSFGLVLGAMVLTSCAATHVTSISEGPGFNTDAMKRVLVIVLARKPHVQHVLEDRFVAELKLRKRDAVAAHTVVPAGEKLDLAAWRRLVDENRFDSVIVSRLVALDVIKKDLDPKLGGTDISGGYGYYDANYPIINERGDALRKETVAMETRVYQGAGERWVWSARSKTEIETELNLETQAQDFTRLMVKQIFQ